MAWFRCTGGNGGGGASILDGTTSPTSSQGSNGQIYLKHLPDLSSINIRESISNSAVGAYFDTGYYYNANTRIEMKVNLSGGATYPSFFGTRADTSGRGTQQMFIATYGTRAYYAFGCVEVYTDDFFSLNTDVLFKTQGRLLNRVQGGVTKEMVTNAYENTPVASIYLFAANLNGAPWTDSYCIMTFYYCKIFEGDTLVHYYLPALDGSDVPCLYDCITGDYIYNSGTGTLTVGNAATIEKSITNSYAKVSGAWQDLIGTDIDDIDETPPALVLHSGKIDLNTGDIVADSDYYYSDYFDAPNGWLTFSVGETSASSDIGVEMCLADGSHLNYYSASSLLRQVDTSTYYVQGLRKLRLSFRKIHLEDVYVIDNMNKITYGINFVRIST